MFQVTFGKKVTVKLTQSELRIVEIQTGKLTYEEAFQIACENGANPDKTVRYTSLENKVDVSFEEMQLILDTFRGYVEKYYLQPKKMKECIYFNFKHRIWIQKQNVTRVCYSIGGLEVGKTIPIILLLKEDMEIDNKTFSLEIYECTFEHGGKGYLLGTNF